MVQFNNLPTQRARDALHGTKQGSFWLANDPGEVFGDRLSEDTAADLLVIGAGFTGLWTAILAKQAEPNRDVVLVDGGVVAWAASGRNGGFVSASITHGFANAMARWPEEMPTLLRLGHENLDAIESFVREHHIECDFIRPGELSVAVAEHQIEELVSMTTAAQALGEHERFLDQAQTLARIDSPTYLAAALDEDGVALVDPVRLARGMARVARELGVRIYEHTPIRRLHKSGRNVVAASDQATIIAQKVILATNAFPPLLRRIKAYIVPVYDYVLVTEPLSDAQWSRIGWGGREGVADVGNRFHYYRTTQDGRILWGGYDAMYHFGGKFSSKYDHHAESYLRLAEHFLQTFPQLEGIRFTHQWGGAIDTCSRFTAYWGTAMQGLAAYVVGFTGLGVGASRFGAATVLDLVDGRDTERTRLEMVRSKPIPFPPEPLRQAGISITTASLAKADEGDGSRNLWLRTLDRVGMGFDS